MSYDFVQLTEIPKANEMYMIVGWRQWADGGMISSGLPRYLVQKTQARKIGSLSPDGFYLFQIPGTHDLVRPIVQFQEGYPEFFEEEENDFFFTEVQGKGLVIFIGDEPHLDALRYLSGILYVVKKLNVQRIIGLGGVYGELPYNKERMVSSNYSLPHLKNELAELAVNLSEYQGGASIGSYLCYKASQEEVEYVSFYGFVPTYDFSSLSEELTSISIENDFAAWLGIMRRINHMLKIDIDLTDLEEKSRKLHKLMDSRIEEIDRADPGINVYQYLQRLSEEFEEQPFHPLEDFWEEELGRLFDKFDSEEE